MNFDPQTKAWILLFTLVCSTGLAAGYTAFLTGASVWGASAVGVGTAASNVYHALSDSPKDKATKPPFPPAS